MSFTEIKAIFIAHLFLFFFMTINELIIKIFLQIALGV